MHLSELFFIVKISYLLEGYLSTAISTQGLVKKNESAFVGTSLPQIYVYVTCSRPINEVIARLNCVTTWMGDRLGIHSAADL